MVNLTFTRNTVGLLTLTLNCLISQVLANQKEVVPCIAAPGQRNGKYSAFVQLPNTQDPNINKRLYENSPDHYDAATHPDFMNGYTFNVELVDYNAQDLLISSKKHIHGSPYRLWFVGFFDGNKKSIKQFYLAGWDTCSIHLEGADMIGQFAQIGVYNLDDDFGA